MLKVGDEAPLFSLADANGQTVSLSDFKGSRVILYFYPKDDTPGCTKEAISFRDVFDGFLEAGAVVIGVSPDHSNSHARFKEKYGLPFYLLCDPDHQVSSQYGAWGEKKQYGRTTLGVIRSTFLIDPSLNIQKVWPKVSPENHGQLVLDALKGSTFATGGQP